MRDRLILCMGGWQVTIREALAKATGSIRKIWKRSAAVNCSVGKGE